MLTTTGDRKEKKQKKKESAKVEDAEALYERRPRNEADSDDDERAPGVPLEALPVKTEAGELKYIKPDRKLKGTPKDTGKAPRRRRPAESATGGGFELVPPMTRGGGQVEHWR